MKSGLTAALVDVFPDEVVVGPVQVLKACQVAPLAVATVSTWDLKSLS